MSVIQTSDIIIPNDPTIIKQIYDACQELSASMTRSEGEKSFQKEALDDLSKATGIPKKHLAKLAKLHHKQNKSEVEAENETTSELYDRIFPTNQ